MLNTGLALHTQANTFTFTVGRRIREEEFRVKRDILTLKSLELRGEPGWEGRNGWYKVETWEQLRVYRAEPRPVLGFWPPLPIPSLSCHFLSARRLLLLLSARPDSAQLGPTCVHSPSSAVSPRPDPAADPGPSHSLAPCRSVPRRSRIGYWQRDNLPCQQKETWVRHRQTVRGGETYKNKNKKQPKTERWDGEGTRPRKESFFSRRFQQWVRFFNVMNIRRVQSENPRCCCEKKSFHSELCWLLGGTDRSYRLRRHRQAGRTQERRFRCHLST